MKKQFTMNNVLTSALIVTMCAFLFISGYILVQSFQKPVELNYVDLSTQCNEDSPNTSVMLDCWMGVIEGVYTAQGTEQAFEVFEHLYNNYDEFATSGCHRQAHRVGDYGYYYDYLTHRDLSKVSFPPNANSCGFGFYHGFVEHLVQGNPTPEFAVESCEYIINKVQDYVPHIEYICYHAAGHGFLIAQADAIAYKEDMTMENFTRDPIAKCAQLDLHPGLKQECNEGVFNVFVSWMLEDNFGFTYNETNPFISCNELSTAAARSACTIEMTRGLSHYPSDGFRLSDYLDLVKTSSESQLYSRMFGIIVAGFIQYDPSAVPTELVLECREVDKDFQAQCLTSVVSGTFEHGAPGAEYTVANKLCEEDILNESERELCYSTMDEKLHRFQTPGEIRGLCESNILSQNVCTYLAK